MNQLPVCSEHDQLVQIKEPSPRVANSTKRVHPSIFHPKSFELNEKKKEVVAQLAGKAWESAVELSSTPFYR